MSSSQPSITETSTPENVASVRDATDDLDDSVDNTIIWSCIRSNLQGLGVNYLNTYSMGSDEADCLMKIHQELDKYIFDCSLKIKELLHSSIDHTSSVTSNAMVLSCRN